MTPPSDPDPRTQRPPDPHTLDSLAGLLRCETPDPALGETEWLAVVRLAGAHRVLSQLREATTTLQLAWPAGALLLAQQMQRSEAGMSLAQFDALREILAASAAAGLRPLPLKGPALMARLYGDPARRAADDLDLLLPAAEQPAFAEILSRLGYRMHSQTDSAKQDWSRGMFAVEVHTHFEEPFAVRFPVGPIWQRALPCVFSGQPAWQLHASDELLFLALHTVRHRFGRLSWAAEFGRAWQLLSPELVGAGGFWQPMAGQRASHLTGVLLLAVTMARRVSPLPLPTGCLHTTARIRRETVTLADTFWKAALSGDPIGSRRLGIIRRMEATQLGKVRVLAGQLWHAGSRVAPHLAPHLRLDTSPKRLLRRSVPSLKGPGEHQP